MHKHVRLSLLFAAAVSITACTPKEPSPAINFIGISTGSVVTDLEELEFSETFPTSIRNILGVVSFAEVQNGTKVQATWFSPDDRRMPLGRHTIEVESGANVAKFSIARQEDWNAAPYMLDIRAFIGEGEEQKTASGQVHFFVGMTDEEIAAYKEEYNTWFEAERAKRETAQVEQAKRDASVEVAKMQLESDTAGMAYNYELGETAIILVVDPFSEDDVMNAFPTQTGALFSIAADNFAIMDNEKNTLLLAKKDGNTTNITNGTTFIAQGITADDQLTIHAMPDSILFTWMFGEQSCTSTFTLANNSLKETNRSCTTQ